MRLQNSFTLAGEPGRVFEVLLDVERIAGCMPGSRLLGRDGDVYEGQVKVKVGPLGVSYRGKVRFLEVDEAGRRVVLKASGTELNGNGNADAHVVAEVAPDTAGTKVSIDTDLMIRGRVAQFGRGVIGDVSQRIIDEFAKNLEDLMTRPTPEPGPPAGVGGAAEPGMPRSAESEAAMDGLRLIALPLLRRAAPVLAGFAAGTVAGALAARSRLRRRHRY
jgi:carbon monoxide dehydrogenase subunit G